MKVGDVGRLAAAVLLAATAAAAQEAPLLTVLPRAEQVRRLELRADLRMIQKRYLEAIDLYQEALVLAPQNAVLLNKTGIAFHQQVVTTAPSGLVDRIVPGVYAHIQPGIERQAGKMTIPATNVQDGPGKIQVLVIG